MITVTFMDTRSVLMASADVYVSGGYVALYRCKGNWDIYQSRSQSDGAVCLGQYLRTDYWG